MWIKCNDNENRLIDLSIYKEIRGHDECISGQQREHYYIGLYNVIESIKLNLLYSDIEKRNNDLKRIETALTGGTAERAIPFIVVSEDTAISQDEWNRRQGASEVFSPGGIDKVRADTYRLLSSEGYSQQEITEEMVTERIENDTAGRGSLTLD